MVVMFSSARSQTQYTSLFKPPLRSNGSRSRREITLRCLAGPPSTWQQVGCGAASLVLSLQALTAPCLALEAQLTPGLLPQGAAPAPAAQQLGQLEQLATPPELRLAQALPPLPSTFLPLPPLALPKYQELVLPNGLRVFLIEDHEVPLLKGTLLMRGGQRASPAEKLGVATISAGLQRAGGSVAHPESALDDALEERGAYIEGGAGGDAISLGFQCLAEDAREILGLFAEVALTPALPQSKLDLSKSQVLNVVEHLNDNPRSIPGRELSKLIYGKESPLAARSPTPEQVRSIQLEDVRQYLSTWERPDAAVLGLVGDFDSRQMAGWVRECFGGWRPGPGQPPKPLPLPNPPLPDQAPIAGRLFLVDIPGATQSSVAVGEVGIALMDPDDFPLDVLTDVLNSFGGRLFDQIRSREGLAYSVSGGWASTPVDHPGLFLATAETAQPAQLLAALRSALQEATVIPPSEEEVARAKEETLNSFVFNFSSPTSQLNRLVSYSLPTPPIPKDYLFQYQRGIEAVTPQQILQAAQRHLHPDRQTVVVAGDAARIRGELERQGWVVEELKLQGS